MAIVPHMNSDLRFSESELSDTLWWSAGATRVNFPRRKKTFDIRIGCIGSDDIRTALDPECNVVLLTPRNWKAAISCKALDLVIIEPCMRSQNGLWDYQFADAKAISTEALDFLQYCRDMHMPIVGWITSDVSYFDLHSGFAQYFDKVFCSDRAFINKLAQIGFDAEHLPTSVQTSIYNPFTEITDSLVDCPPIIFDGLTSVLQSDDLSQKLLGLVDYGLGIVESRAIIRSNRRERYEQLAQSMLGSVTVADRLFLLKRASILVQCAGNTSRQIEEKLALEAAACRTVVLCFGELEKDDARVGFAHIFSHWPDLVCYVGELLADRMLWLRESQKSWRFVHRNHSIASSVAVMLTAVGRAEVCRAVPRAAIVSPTIRPDLLQKVISQFRVQTWPNKELVVVANSSTAVGWDASLLDPDGSEHLVFVPTDFWAGAALNIGALRSSGEVIFRLDDDDIYGEHYIEDCMLHLISVDPDIMGKSGAFLYSEETGKLYRNTSRDRFPILIDASDLYENKVSLAGFTISVRLDRMRERGYPEQAFGFADTAFLKREKDIGELRVAVLDPMNAVYERRVDLSTHTWQQSLDWHARALEPLSEAVADILV